jgi:hypothetical protein
LDYRISLKQLVARSNASASPARGETGTQVAAMSRLPAGSIPVTTGYAQYSHKCTVFADCYYQVLVGFCEGGNGDSFKIEIQSALCFIECSDISN